MTAINHLGQNTSENKQNPKPMNKQTKNPTNQQAGKHKTSEAKAEHLLELARSPVKPNIS